MKIYIQNIQKEHFYLTCIIYVSYSYYQLDYIVYIELLYERKIKINMQKYFLDQQRCSHWRGQGDHASSTTSISEAIKVQSFQFKTSGILLSMGVQKLYGPEISLFLPCMLQFLDDSRWLFFFSNYTRGINYVMLDFLKRSDT